MLVSQFDDPTFPIAHSAADAAQAVGRSVPFRNMR